MRKHLIVVYEAFISQSDYPGDEPGDVRWIATCTCGWHVTRQHLGYASNQAEKHRQAVAA